ncbi:MAG: CehA/McbA family metallohydrolase [bacterium]|nr:CehA/McbA family metallohydrolase [Candidatus Sumerlaeota bacterium]
MKIHHSIIVILLAVAAQAPAATHTPEQTTMPRQLNWYKGNTHTHTNKSDGDTSPGAAACWYRDHGYDFLVISDHNRLTTPSVVEKEMAGTRSANPDKPFLLISGEEVSDCFTVNKRGLPLHIGAIGASRTVGVQGGKSVADTVERCIGAIHAGGGIAHVNHPNFGWAMTSEDLLALPNITHMEIFNGHPDVNNWGGGGKPSAEAMWDALLSAGRRVYAIASDDAHHYMKYGRDLANVGRGWIVARAAAPDRDDILAAIRDGNYYASTGVELDDISTTNSTLSLKIRKQGSRLFTTSFIGANGVVLKEDASMEPKYKLKPGGAYVRARVLSSGGDYAWTQPLFAQTGGKDISK